MESANLTDNIVEFKKESLLECPFCKRQGESVIVDEWAKGIDTHLIITISDIGTPKEHCHLHGCVDNPTIMLRMMDYIRKEIEKKVKK
jgi:hypothetical protein